MQPLSKGFYLGSYIGGVIAAVLLMVIGFALVANEEEAGMVFIFLGYVPMIYAVVVVCVLIYKMWSAIQGPTARSTPGKALGFLFIPFYNFYWIFMAFWGWTKDYNALANQRGMTQRAPEGLALAMCNMTLCGIIPFLGYLIALVNIVVTVAFYNSAINCVNALAAAPAEMEVEASI